MVPKICSVDGCTRAFSAKDLCNLHYLRKLRTGSTGSVGTSRPAEQRTLHERFWSRVNKSGACWEWTGSRFGDGYGQFSLHGRSVGAHRQSYELAHGPIPAGLVIDHMCHNPACVNPDHLRAVTTKQNIEHQRGANRSSTTGIRGVRPGRPGMWRAEVRHLGIKVSAGTYKTIEEAEAAAIAKRNELFTCNDADRRTKN